uniref:leucine-rich repeat-containing protein 25 n=1 Tax=Jaculus jaculus TaxID=51337 RepID=UPI001E1B2AB3|nr:leucine-rich repeat-containing protein 25 [Jaculus jaculus]XP_045000718.1 leucine-rich repeat-containing protein 25 [Jaculus jaculus]
MGAPRVEVPLPSLLLLLLLLLLLGLQKLRSQELSCAVFPGHVDWNQEFDASCLNFSGRGLHLPKNRSLQASRLQVLDLSCNGLRELPRAFFDSLENLRVLDVTHNPLGSVDAALATRCDRDLRADCACSLLAWQVIRRDNCSHQPPLLCLQGDTGIWKNLSTFLQVSCPPGLAPATIGGLVAGGILFLVFAITGLVLAWRLQGHRAASGQGLGKAWQGGPRPGTGSQDRYSSRHPSPKQSVDTPTGRNTPEYENIFLGQPADGHQWMAPRVHPPEDSDVYMNYKGAHLDHQPVYGNLEALGGACPQEEENVVHGY